MISVENNPTEQSPGPAAPTGARIQPAKFAEKAQKSGTAENSATAPQPLPRRSKGQVFWTLVLLAVTAGGAFVVWNALFRYSAHGMITGRVVRVTSTTEGRIDSVHVREGDAVHQGQLLATLDNWKFTQLVDSVRDDLRLAQSDVQSELADVKWRAYIRGSEHREATAEYYQAYGNLLQQTSKIADLEQQLKRLEAALRLSAVPEVQVESVRIVLAGQRAKVKALTRAVESHKNRVDWTAIGRDRSSGRLKAKITRVETIQAKLKRLQQTLARQTQIRSPINGRVVRIHRFPGESVDSLQEIVEILQEGSQEVVLYVRSSQTDELQPGQQVELKLLRNAKPFICVVKRSGEGLVLPPEHLRRYYRHDEKLLPVHLQIKHDWTGSTKPRFHIGSEVRLSREWLSLPSLTDFQD